jgi:hypothetical protein
MVVGFCFPGDQRVLKYRVPDTGMRGDDIGVFWCLWRRGICRRQLIIGW